MQASPAQHRSFLWQPPGQRLSIDLRLDVVDRMVVEIAEGMRTPGRGIEVGGLLLGRTRRESGEVVVHVEEFEPVECEHAAGPSFMLSATDRQILERRLRQRKSANGRSIVGFYRSNTRREFAVTIEDVALMSSYFSDGADVLLLVHAPREEPLTAGFVIWEGRTIRSHRPYLVFPFDGGALMSRAHSVDDIVLAPQPVAARQPSPPSDHTRLRLPASWIVAGVLAAAVTGGVLLERPGQHSTKSPDRARQADSVATSARVSPRPVPGADAPDAPVSRGLPETVPSRAEAPDAAAPVRTESAEKLAPETAVEDNGESRMAERRAAEETPRGPKTYTAPAAQAILAESAEAKAIDPPRVDGAPRNAVPIGSLDDLLRTPAAPNPATAAPAREAVVRVAADTGAAQSAKFQPPTPVRQARPEIPPDIRRRITSDVLINVRVYVNAAGTVEFAELLSDGTGANRDLASLSVFAARHWRFSPANSNGKAVPGQAVLRFRYAPEER